MYPEQLVAQEIFSVWDPAARLAVPSVAVFRLPQAPAEGNQYREFQVDPSSSSVRFATASLEYTNEMVVEPDALNV
jgi:hypothetical protein